MCGCWLTNKVKMLIKDTFKSKHADKIRYIALIPNVSEFQAIPTGLELDALLYGIEKVMREVYVTKLNKGEYNEYLERQMLRLSWYAHSNQLEKYLSLSKILMTKSTSFRLKFMNEVDRKWFTCDPAKIDAQWRKYSKLCTSQSSNLIYKRVWISDPGKEEKYTRPLGVPTPEWRFYSRMKLDIMERWFKGRGMLASWQHGGRSKKGTLSCFKEVLPKLLSYRNIFEFDIKGFFNNVAHESIISLFKQNFTPKIMKGFLNNQPSSYKLPEAKEDKAILQNEKLLSSAVMMEEVPIDQFLNKIGFTGAPSLLKERLLTDEEILQMLDESKLDVPVLMGTKGLQDFMAIPVDDDGLSEEDRKLLEGLDLVPLDTETEALRYSQAMKDDYSLLGAGQKPSEEGRAKGRDMWKGLGQEGKGVPQGLGTSPFLSTLMTDIHLKPLGDRGGLTMYMDDGMLFTNNDEEDIMGELNQRLQEIGLEIEPKKSRPLKLGNRWLNSFKFLGMRFNGDTCELESETRAGTKKPFPQLLSIRDFIAKLDTLTGKQWKRWQLEHYSRVKTIEDRSWKSGLKYGYLGLLISKSQYPGVLTDLQMKAKSKAGQAEAWREAVKAERSLIWQNSQNSEQTLTNISSIACTEFLLVKSSPKFFNKRTGKLTSLTFTRFSRLKGWTAYRRKSNQDKGKPLYSFASRFQ